MSNTVLDRHYDLLIFDWDGTLMDSAGHIVAAMQRAIQDAGLPERSPDQLRDLIGLGLNETVGHLFPRADPERVRNWLSAYRQRYLMPAGQPVLFGTARQTLQQLVDVGYELAVATGKSRRGLDRALRQTGTQQYFCCTRCADEATSKPAPDMVDDILLRTATLPTRALVIGDTEYDMGMARSAGVDALGVSCGVHDVERLRATGATTVLPSIADLPAWLGNRRKTSRETASV